MPETAKPPGPKISETHVPAHPDPKDPRHAEWHIDEASDESFPASDPSAETQPQPTKKHP